VRNTEFSTPEAARHPRPAKGLRLALFSGNYNYTRDGANQALNRLVDHLCAAGAEVRVYSPTTQEPAFQPCGELVSAPSVRLPGRKEYRVPLGLTPALREDIARFAPTAFHLSSPDPLNCQAAKLARRLGAPVVASLHTRFETYLSYYHLGWLRPAVERYLDRFYGACDCVLAPNAPIAEMLTEHGAQSVRIWDRGVDRDQFSPERRDLGWRRALGVADDEVVVAFLGRLVKEKGLDLWAEVVDGIPGRPVRPLVIGDGPYAGALKARLPNAIYTGALTGPELGRAVASSDVLFNPSLTEAFGNATLEAMAAGLAVLCPKAPSTAALIQDGIDGVLVERPGAEAYVRALERLADDQLGRRRMGAAARRASGEHSWERSCAEVLQTYRDLGAVRALAQAS
jgi:phosphatidylinositol alpha 1,6-mannosyltransferase